LAIIDNQNLGPEYSTYADRDDLLFANAPGSAGRRIFHTNESYDISVDLTLDATYNEKRKEAGLRVNKDSSDMLFFVTTTPKEPTIEDPDPPDLNEIVAYGGYHPFYSFTVSQGLGYTPGTPITLRMIYRAPIGTPVLGSFEGDYDNDGWVHAGDYTVWRDHLGGSDLPNDPTPEDVTQEDYDLWIMNYGNRAGSMEYLVTYGGEDYTSGRLRFTNNEGGMVDASQMGVFAQGAAISDEAHADDDYTATFSNFVWGDGTIGEGAGSGSALVAHGVPEPTSFSLIVFGLTASLWLARFRPQRA
jgi:hypothetical protein